MTDLDNLIEAVEAGSIAASDFDPFARALGVTSAANDAHMAYRGSLDAAKALHDALLPGWRVVQIGQAHAHQDDTPDIWRVWIVAHDFLDSCDHAEAKAGSPARAWLLAILKAYRAQVQK